MAVSKASEPQPTPKPGVGVKGDREAEIQAILAGPEFMDCPAGAGARIRKAVCVDRQSKGIMMGSVWGDRIIPYSCRDCETGRAVLEVYREGGDEGMRKDFKARMYHPETDPPEPPPGGKAFYIFFTEGPPPRDGAEKLPLTGMTRASSDLGDRDTINVDFRGREDLLERFRAEASAAGDTPAEHMLWLVGVYVNHLDGN
jgi:hypothetical protein